MNITGLLAIFAFTLVVQNQAYDDDGDENHLRGASLRESRIIHHAHGTDCHHMHQRHGAGTPHYSSMLVSPSYINSSHSIHVGLVRSYHESEGIINY